MKKFILFLFVGSIFISVKCQTNTPVCKVKITSPNDLDSATWRTIVRGTVHGSKNVWVVVRPMILKDRWVQPAVSFKNDTTWQTLIYISEPGPRDIGQHYEIKAFVNPSATLKEGDKLLDWPDAACSSDIIEVIRKGVK